MHFHHDYRYLRVTFHRPFCTAFFIVCSLLRNITVSRRSSSSSSSSTLENKIRFGRRGRYNSIEQINDINDDDDDDIGHDDNFNILCRLYINVV